MPKLSVITINLNNASGLRKTIESVINQTYGDYEYIIIDGGSTDGSREIIEEFSEKVTYWVSEPDKGIYNAMNKGIIQSKGEYFNFLNSGDILIDGVLSKIFDNEVSEDILFGDIILKNNSIENSSESRIYYGTKITLFNLFESGFPHQSAFIKRSLMTSNLYREDLKIVADLYFFLKVVIFNNATLRYFSFPIVYYDLNGISSVGEFHEIHQSERRKVLAELIPERILADYDEFFDLASSPLKKHVLFLSHTSRLKKYLTFVVGLHIKIYSHVKKLIFFNS